MSRQYFVRDRGRTMGPFTYDQLFDMRDRGQIQAYHEVSIDQRTWKAFDLMFASQGSSSGTRQSNPGPSPQKGMRKPPPGSNRTLWIVAGSVGGLVVVAGIVVVVILMMRSRGTEDTKNSAGITVPEGVISFNPTHSLDERYRVYSQAVGFVANGVTARTADTNEEMDIPGGTGSGFCVSESGYMITNKHVVEEYLSYDGSDQQRDDMSRLRLKNAKPKLWVFFGLTDKHEVQSVHASENYDLAIIKIDRKAPYRFALCDTPDSKFPLLETVFTLGYPGEDRRAQEALFGRQPNSLMPGKRIQAFYRDVDFRVTFEKGHMKRQPFRGQDADRKELEAGYINHAARIRGGNSGGPLIADDGTVIGINTLGINTVIKELVLTDDGRPVLTKEGKFAYRVRKIEQEGQNHALTMQQLRTEIDRSASGVAWRPAPTR